MSLNTVQRAAAAAEAEIRCETAGDAQPLWPRVEQAGTVWSSGCPPGAAAALGVRVQEVSEMWVKTTTEVRLISIYLNTP